MYLKMTYQDMSGHYLWELIHLKSQVQRRQEKIYHLSNRQDLSIVRVFGSFLGQFGPFLDHFWILFGSFFAYIFQQGPNLTYRKNNIFFALFQIQAKQNKKKLKTTKKRKCLDRLLIFRIKIFQSSMKANLNSFEMFEVLLKVFKKGSKTINNMHCLCQNKERN